MTHPIQRRLDTAARSSAFIYANTAVILPTCLLSICRELGFSYTQAGSLSFIGSLMQFSVLLASIPVAARWGKIRPLRWGIWLLALGLLLFTGIWDFASAMTVMAVMTLGQALLESLLTPLVEDIHPGDDGTHQAHLHAFWPIGIIFGTLTVGEALTRGMSWRTAFLVLGCVSVAAGFLYPHHRKTELPPSRADFSHAGEILRCPEFWLLGFALFFAGGAEGGMTYWTASFIQVEYAALPRAGAAGTAMFALGMAAGRFTAGKLASRLGLTRILLTATAAALVLGFVFFQVSHLAAVYACIGLLGLCMAPHWPSIQTYTVRRIDTDPTMTMALLSCFGLLGFSSASLLIGRIADTVNMRTGFLAIPSFLIMLLILLIAERRLRQAVSRRHSGRRVCIDQEDS